MDQPTPMADAFDLMPFETDPPTDGGGVWVFAYGSLMWRPGFAYLDMRTARLYGYHRALCIYSIRYRGTPEKPGLVLGLDRGGCCVGRAYRVAIADWPAVRDYLYGREMIHRTYEPRFLRVRFAGGGQGLAYTFVARPEHRQYAGGLPEARVVELVRQGVGGEGASREYVANTVGHLDDLGIRDGLLHRILRRVQAAD